MDSNPFANDILDAFDSVIPRAARLDFHEDVFTAMVSALFKPRAGDTTGAEERNPRAAKGWLCLLTAPHAGYGKTHLLARLKLRTAETHVMVPLRFQRERKAGWESLLSGMVDYCDVSPGPSGSISLLEELARHVFTELTANLIRDGEIPAPNPEEAVRALKDRPDEMFDFSNNQKEVAKWFRSVFETLLPSYAAEAVRCYDVSDEQARFWLRSLYAYCRDCAQGDAVSRATRLKKVLRAGDSEWKGLTGEPMEKERFAGLGRIMSRWRPVVMVADHLDPLFGLPEMGRDVTCLVLEILKLVPGSVSVLSLNLDLWESVFDGNLPGALEDRLTSNRLTLGGISFEEAEQLIEYRLAAAGIPDDVKFRFYPMLNLEDLYESGNTDGSPRSLLRQAAEYWDRFAASGYEVEPAGIRVEREAFPIAERRDADSAPQAAEKEAVPPPVWDGSAALEGVEFVSLTEESPETRQSPYAPLEPLMFTTHLTTNPLESEPTREFAAPTGGGESPRHWSGLNTAVEETSLPEADALPSFDWTAAVAQQAAMAHAELPFAEVTAIDSAANDTSVPVSTAPLPQTVDSQPSPGAEAPTLEGTIDDLMAEAQKAFFGFRDIFRQFIGDEAETREADSAARETGDGLAEVYAPEFREPGSEACGAASPDDGAATAAGTQYPKPQFELPGFSTPRPTDLDFSASQMPCDESAAAEELHRLPANYNRLRREELASLVTGELDLLRFYAVIKAVGDLSPIVKMTEFDLPKKPGYRVVRWSYDNHHILFGFLALENGDYWQELMRYAFHLDEAIEEGAWGGEEREVKVVALIPSGLPLDLTSWKASLNQRGAPRAAIDAVRVDPETVGAVHAADRLLDDVAARRISQDRHEVLNLVTRELDFFWRRLTLPIASGACLGS